MPTRAELAKLFSSAHFGGTHRVFLVQVPDQSASQPSQQAASRPANGTSASRSDSPADGATSALSGRPPPGFPPASPSLAAAADGNSGAAPVDDTWRWWHHVRALCGHSTKLGVLLVVPITLTDASAVDRWLGEPAKAVLLPTAAFLTNRKGFPVLSRPHQDLLAKVFQHGIQVHAALWPESRPP